MELGADVDIAISADLLLLPVLLGLLGLLGLLVWLLVIVEVIGGTDRLDTTES